MRPYILQAAWIDSNCKGPPAALYNFTDASSSWTSIFNQSLLSFPDSRCGLGPIDLYDGCCVTSLDGNSDYQSALIAQQSAFHITSNVLKIDPLQSASYPVIDATAKYCHLQGKDRDSLNGYFDWYILENDNSCFEDRLRCYNNTLYIFGPSDPPCSGMPVVVGLLQGQDQSSSLGELFVNSVNLNLEASILWTTFVPSNRLVPVPDHFSYYISLGFVILSIFGTLAVGGFYSYKYYKGRTRFMLAYLLSQFLWLGWILVDTCYVYSAFKELKTMRLFRAISMVLLGVVTLLSAFISANVLLIFMKRYNLRNQVLFFFALLFLHLFLSGCQYAQIGLQFTSYCSVGNHLSSVWIIFIYFFDLTPPLFVFLTLLKSIPNPKPKTSAKTIFVLHSHDKLVGFLLILQLLNALCYATTIYISDFTAYLVNDRFMLSLHGFFSFSFVFHSVLSCILNHHIRYMLKLGQALETQKQSTLQSALRPSNATQGMPSMNSKRSANSINFSKDNQEFTLHQFYPNGPPNLSEVSVESFDDIDESLTRSAGLRLQRNPPNANLPPVPVSRITEMRRIDVQPPRSIQSVPESSTDTSLLTPLSPDSPFSFQSVHSFDSRYDPPKSLGLNVPEKTHHRNSKLHDGIELPRTTYSMLYDRTAHRSEPHKS